jgi:hypothetical protein
MRARAGTTALVAVLAMLLAPVATGAGEAHAGGAGAAGSRWAPAAKATIRPGVMMYTKGVQCTGNFVFTGRRGRVYVGYAAHCAGTGPATATNGCTAKSRPLGTRVRFADDRTLSTAGTTVGRGRLVYSSWLTMQRRGTKRPNVCAYNDFALVRVGRRHVKKVNPSVPFWGGPVGLHTGRTGPGETVHSYGSSSLRAGLSALSPKQGTSLGTTGNGWSHPVYMVTPGVPGDSGSAFLDAHGRALGVLSTLAVAPLAGSNGVGDLSHELAFARRHSGIDRLRLVRGTTAFDPVL